MLEKKASPVIDLSEIPRGFICPITTEIMVNPVAAADGQSYEKAAIEVWFHAGHNTSPATGEPLPNQNLIPNIQLRQTIEEYNVKKPLLEEHIHTQEELLRLVEARNQALSLELGKNTFFPKEDEKKSPEGLGQSKDHKAEEKLPEEENIKFSGSVCAFL